LLALLTVESLFFDRYLFLHIFLAQEMRVAKDYVVDAFIFHQHFLVMAPALSWCPVLDDFAHLHMDASNSPFIRIQIKEVSLVD